MSRKTKVRTATRKCASCGEPFTWTSRNPKRRFCDPKCKSRWWRVSNNDTAPTTDQTSADAATAAAISTAQRRTDDHTDGRRTEDGERPVTANAVTPSYDPYVAGYGTGQTPSAIQDCPNCHQPVAVINLLVTSAAAYVNTPSRNVTNHS